MQKTIWDPNTLVPQTVALVIALLAFILMCMSYSTSFSDKTRKRLTIAYATLTFIGGMLCIWMIVELHKVGKTVIQF